MKFEFIVVALFASITNGQPYCEDSKKKFNINGSKDNCSRDDLVCSGDFNSDAFSSHCKATCNVTNCCVDATAKFWNGPDSGYKDCEWVGKNEERCDDEDVANTCPVSCKLCNPPTVYEVLSEIDLLKASQARICENEQICNRFGGYRYIDGFGCLPTAYRNNEEMVFIGNKLEQDWDSHKQAAIDCGGRLADVYDETENEKIYLAFEDGTRKFIGGTQQKPCDDEPSGCWVWSDGAEMTYKNWYPGQPDNHLGFNQDCMILFLFAASPQWDDNYCDRVYSAIYILPPTFNTISTCNILPEEL